MVRDPEVGGVCVYVCSSSLEAECALVCTAREA